MDLAHGAIFSVPQNRRCINGENYSGLTSLNILMDSWRQFKEGLLIRFRPTDYENIDGQLAKIQQTSTIQEYQTRFERLSNQTHDWSQKQLLTTFIEGLKPEIRGEVKA